MSGNWSWKPPAGVPTSINRGAKKMREFMKEHYGQKSPTAARRKDPQP